MSRAKRDNRTTAQLLRELVQAEHDIPKKQWHHVLAALRPMVREHGDHELANQLRTGLVIVEEIGLRDSSVLAHLLEQPVIMGFYTITEARKTFGNDVAHLLELLLRVSELYATSPVVTTENFSHFLLSFAEDVRIILILLARRLQLLRVAEYHLDEDARLSLAIEASYLYAPLAHRLGLYGVKSEMEDLCLKYTDRETFDYVKNKLAETKASRDAYIAAFIKPVRKRLDEAKLKYTIKGRTKSISSIRNKLKKKRVAFEEIYDLFAIRIVLDSAPEDERAQCWQVYSIITDMYRPNPERLKDWVSIPKSNGYESLHITVMGPDQRWVEVQIRTQRMDEVAEKGLAAHWRYKGIRSESGLDEFMTSVRSLLENPNQSEEERIQAFKMDLYDEEIYVFTPKGDLVKLPKGATTLDFAYQIHTRVGSHTVSAKVNGTNVSLRHVLQNGDTVEVITSKNQQPKADWLNYVTTGRARTKIKASLRAQNEQVVRLAREELERRLKNRKLPYDAGVIGKVARKMGYKQLTSFFLDMSQDRVDISAFLDRYRTEMETPETDTMERLSAEDYISPTIPERITQEKEEVLLIDKNLSGIDYRFAKCCNPIYGDKIFAFTSSKGMSIHRMDCPNAQDLFRNYGYRILKAEWTGQNSGGYEAALRVVGHDDLSVVNNISGQIATEKEVTLRSFKVNSEDSLFIGYFYVYVKSLGVLTTLINKLRTTKGVKKVERVD